MNLLRKKWLVKGTANLSNNESTIIIENNSSSHSILIYPRLFKRKGDGNLVIRFKGKVKSGTACVLKMINRHKTILNEVNLNSICYVENNNYKYYLLVIYVPGNSKMEIDKLEIDYQKNTELFNSFNSDILVVTPGYPTLDNKYNCGFVHTRVKAYQKENWNVDVTWIGPYNSTSSYNYDGVHVVKSNYYFLRCLLQKRKYKKILIHFFDNNYANVLESVDTSDTMLYFYLHGAETLYWDWPKLASRYFLPPSEINDELRNLFKIKDFFIKKYNNIKNAKWIFVTNWTKNRCEELLNIKFNNSDVIPCLIDTDLFKYEKKDPELRKKIFVLRKFDDINSYSLDTVVRVILELSHRDIFSDLEFDIYGRGSLHDTLLAPIKDFPNVHIYDKFLTHEEIRDVHHNHGIALFPTRFDSQAVSSCEAASSGCAVITSDIPGIRQFIPEKLGVMCEPENFKQYADIIEKMYYDSEFFLKVGREESKSVQSKFDYEHTIQKEIMMFAEEKIAFRNIKVEKPVLSIIVPAYNVEDYLEHTVYSILDQDNASKIEIIIVNDGSKDNTINIARHLEEKYSNGKESLIKIIDKENGGHGSTINAGIKIAQGKYIKIVDGDDTVDSEALEKLINILEHEDSDVILNNYIEDYAKDNVINIQKIYDNLISGIQYCFDDLCYDNYGFKQWGPILSCSSYKTEMLKNSNFKISEKMFYVDMELNIIVAILCNTVTYYDLNLYRYFLGRIGQSVNKESYKRNYKHHENVCIKMLEIYYENKDKISDNKKNYIINKLIIPMISTQYEICISYFNDGKAFREFDKRLKYYHYFYNNRRIKIKKVRFHRKTKGILIRFNNMLVSVYSLFKR